MPSHARALGYAALPDREIFARAAAAGRIVVTFDLDFGEIVGFARRSGCGAVLLRLRLAGQGNLRERLRVAIAEAAEAMQTGAIVVVEDSRIRIRQITPD